MDKSESYPITSGSVPAGKPQNCASRVFHSLMVLIYLTLLVLALVSLGTFAAKHNEIRTESAYALAPKQLGYCILFGTYDSTLGQSGTLILNKSHVCTFTIWGEGVVAMIAVALGLLAVLKMITGKQAVSTLALGELVIIVIGTLLGLAIGIIITVGLNQTCSAYSQIKDIPKSASCSQYILPKKDLSSTFKFYHTIDVAQVTAWIGTCVMLFLSLVYLGILIVYCIRASHRRATLLPSNSPPSYSGSFTNSDAN